MHGDAERTESLARNAIGIEPVVRQCSGERQGLARQYDFGGEPALGIEVRGEKARVGEGYGIGIKEQARIAAGQENERAGDEIGFQDQPIGHGKN